MAVLIVLMLLSMTLALSYAMMRTQSVGVQIHRNSNRLVSARQAALTGIMLAIKKMHRSDWAGVDTTLKGTLSAYDSYQVDYTTGDPTLVSGASDYGDYPYRVTLLAIGTSADAADSQKVATYRIRAVVRLVPRALATEPTDWANMLKFTAYQTSFSMFTVDVPSRIEGPVCAQGWHNASRSIWPDDSDYYRLNSARQQYYRDLNPMRLAGGADCRPHTGKLSIGPYQWSDTSTNLSNLGVTVASTNIQSTSWQPTSQVGAYQLYRGGKVYSVRSLSGYLENQTIEPDVKTNPLGLYFRSGTTELHDNVALRGTLITQTSSGANVYVMGKNVRLEAVSLPALYGTTVPVQLPAVACGNSFYVYDNTDTTILGQVSVANTFEVVGGTQATKMDLTGQVIAGSVDLEPRREWTNKTDSWWRNMYDAFASQKNNAAGIRYWPAYLQKYSDLDPTPRVIVKPSATAVRYHWQTWRTTQGAPVPIFTTATGDEGLRWEMVGWTENPAG